jgi:hypothetical protein
MTHQTKIEVLRINKPFSNQSLEFTVETDLPNVKGLETFTIPAD